LKEDLKPSGGTADGGRSGELSAPRAGSERFPCQECGAGMRWDPTQNGLTCNYCGATREVAALEAQIVERSLDDAGDAQRGLGLELRVVQCKTCGARIALEPPITTESCAYCGSTNVLQQDANRNAIRPESLVPLEVGRAMVEERFQRWLHRLWFRPSELKRTRRFDAVGIYVPFWAFDCEAESDWTAQSGTSEEGRGRRRKLHLGKSRMRSELQEGIRWTPAQGQRFDAVRDEHVHASKGRGAELVRKLGPFNLEQLVPYRPEYLAGWRAEEYQVDLEDGWNLGRRAILERQRLLCAGDVPGDTQKNLRVHTTISDVRWKHVLLPIWSVSYRFRGKTYAVLVHGQSGRVVGKAPWSAVKLGFVLFAVSALTLAYLVYG